MSRTQRWLLYVTTVLATITGLVYAALRYLLDNDDPFSAYNHPAQPWALHLHVIVVPALVFAIGWYWGRHVVPKLASDAAFRPSGLTLIGLVVVMCVSGYLMQVISSRDWYTLLGWTHGVSGSAFFGLLVAHVFRGRRASEKADQDAGSTPSNSRRQCDKVATG